jgi:hypothetical protein
MTRIPPLKGEAPRSAYVARVDGGAEIHPNEAVFPLLAQEEDGSFRLVGTGFFIAQAAIFLTAAHVVEDAENEEHVPVQPLCAVQFRPDGTYLLRSVHVAARNARSDVAIGYLNPRVVTLSAASPQPGDPVVTFAYPKTRTVAGPPHLLDFEPTYFAGEVARHWPNGRDRVLLPAECYQTSMVIHGGASGGPVFGPDGAVFGINSTGYQDEALSFVSSVWDALDLPIPNLRFGTESQPRATNLRELIKLGLVSVK